MTLAQKADFFDGIAERWDSWEDLPSLQRRFDDSLGKLGIAADARIVDVGCGTGSLTQALLRHLSPHGRVEALDISPRMLEIAQRKLSDNRVTWHRADAHHLPFADSTCDHVFCYSVWPHFDNHSTVANEIFRTLKPGGFLHVWHLTSREKINAIHANAGDAVHTDLLAPVQETAALLTSAGFQLVTTIESTEQYLVTAKKLAQ